MEGGKEVLCSPCSTARPDSALPRPAPPCSTHHPSAVPTFPPPPGSYKVIATGQAVTIHPSSVLCGKKAECIVFNELVRPWYWSAPAASERLCCLWWQSLH